MNTDITNYAQQASQPSWYQTDDKSLFYSVTRGTSPHNEWFEFKDRTEAIEFINNTFYSSTFVDNFVYHDGDIYYEYDIMYNQDTYEQDLVIGAEPACIQDMINAESCF